MSKLVWIDPGHGGAPGNVNKGIREADTVLDLSKRLGHYIRLLAKEGDIAGPTRILTKETRTIDEYVAIDTRTLEARRANACLMLSIHTNSSISPMAQGAEAWICSTGTHNGESARLATALLDRLYILGFKNRGIKFDGTNRHGRLGILRGVCWNMPAVLIEVGFASNDHDRRLLADPESRDIIALQLGAAVVGFEGIEPRMELVIAA